MAQHVPVYVNAAQLTGWGRGVATSLNLTITDVKGKQALNDNLTSLSGLSLTGSAGYAVVVNGAEDGFELSAAGGGGVTSNALTVNNGGAGAASGATFNGSAPVTISYNSIGAQPASANLTTFAGIAPSANVQSLLGAANYAAIRTQLTLTVGTDVQAFDADLAALAANSTDGLWARTGAGTGAARTLTAPAAGITISNPAGIAGNPTFALADDLAALEALSGTNTIYYRSGASTWTGVTIGSGLSFSGGTLAKAAFRGALVTKAADETTANYSANPSISWNNETYDTDNIHDNSTNPSRLTVPSGVTRVQLQANIFLSNVAANDDITLDIRKNGTQFLPGLPNTIVDTSFTFPRANLSSSVMEVTAGDYFEVFLDTSTDTSITVTAGISWFAMQIVA